MFLKQSTAYTFRFGQASILPKSPADLKHMCLDADGYTTRTSANADEHVYRTRYLEGFRHIRQPPLRRLERAPERV